MKKGQTNIYISLVVVILAVIAMLSFSMRDNRMFAVTNNDTAVHDKNYEEGMIVKLIDAGSRLPIANLNVSLTLLIDCDSELKCGDIRFLSERKSDEGGKFVIFKNEVKDVPNIPNTYLVLDLGSPEFKSKQLKLLEIEKLQEIVIDNYPACNLDEECQDLACGSRTRFHPMPIPKCVRNFCKCTFDQS